MLKVILIGDHPEGSSGNAHMMHGIASQLDPNKFQFTILAINPRASISAEEIFIPLKWPIMDVNTTIDPNSWMRALLPLVSKQQIDFVIFVGLDIWMFSKVLRSLNELKKARRFLVAAIFPYELNILREDYALPLDLVELPLVYSQYGFNMLKERIRNIQYFRPPLYDADKFIPFSVEEKKKTKEKIFKNLLDKNKFVFGFVGNNQVRKDPQRMIKAFFDVKRKVPTVSLYLHTEIGQGYYNLAQYLKDCGNKHDVFVKKQEYQYDTQGIVEAYNIIDCIVSTSLQEGLSWTILEAMLCGTPVIASNNSAHIELLEGGAGMPIKCTELAYLPVPINDQQSYIESSACDRKDLVEAMLKVATDPKLRMKLVHKGLKRAKEWLAGVSNINDVLLKSLESFVMPITDEQKKEIGIVVPLKKQEVLFAQRASAGDILMTTRALKGVKEMYGNVPLVYMTSPSYIDILINNPYVDKIIPWDEKQFNRYQFVVNPHGDRIGPGHWGRNSNSLLSDFYWKILMVEPTDFFIEKREPPQSISFFLMNLTKPICVLHTTGGDPSFRTYKYMADVAKDLKDRYQTIQVGGQNDFSAGASLDLRGALSFRETAWIVSKAKIAVTVDSFVSHLCGALGVSQVCLFGSGNHFVVRPNQTKGALICLTIDYVNDCRGLGPCSASVRNCPLPCTGRHDPKVILKSIAEIEEELK